MKIDRIKQEAMDLVEFCKSHSCCEGCLFYKDDCWCLIGEPVIWGLGMELKNRVEDKKHVAKN